MKKYIIIILSTHFKTVSKSNCFFTQYNRFYFEAKNSDNKPGVLIGKGFYTLRSKL